MFDPSMLNPAMIGQLLMAAGQGQPGVAGVLDGLQAPLPGTPEFMELMQPGSSFGDVLGGAMSGPPVGTQDILGQMGAKPSGGPPMATPSVNPTGVPMANAMQQQRGGQWPKVSVPEPQKPVFSGGVAGSQKAPEGEMKTGMTPAQALMMAMLGQPGGAGGAKANPLRVPQLGALL